MEDVEDRGPLLATAIALFGEGFFHSERVKKPDFFIRYVAFDAPNYGACIRQAPMLGLMRSTYNKDLDGSALGMCPHNGLREMGSLQDQLAAYVYTLYYDEDEDVQAARVKDSFNAAALLAEPSVDDFSNHRYGTGSILR